VDDTAGFKAVNWHPFDPNRVKNRFTSFAHKPHVDAVGNKGCETCHELSTAADTYLKTYETGDSSRHSPNFKYLDKSLCATCHTRQTVWENCTLCHNYHVNDLSEEQLELFQRSSVRQPSWARSYDHGTGRPRR
jgi:hypothetical protein